MNILTEFDFTSPIIIIFNPKEKERWEWAAANRPPKYLGFVYEKVRRGTG